MGTCMANTSSEANHVKLLPPPDNGPSLTKALTDLERGGSIMHGGGGSALCGVLFLLHQTMCAFSDPLGYVRQAPRLRPKISPFVGRHRRDPSVRRDSSAEAAACGAADLNA
jgi:hypothetical protein